MVIVSLEILDAMEENIMEINEWFDIENIEHIKAYNYLRGHGNWPEGFIPEGTVFNPAWNIIITHNLANAYVDEKLKSEIPSVLLWCLKEIMKELPTKRDWLNPDLEKIIKNIIKRAETHEPK